MTKIKSLKLMSIFLVLTLVLVGCGQKADQAASTQMQYIGIETLKESIESGSNDYIILDNRKLEDFNNGHIVGSIPADMDAANKGGDDASGTANLKEALLEATGNETGDPNAKYALVCYSGKSYAQKATDLMIEMGIKADQIYTVEGGIKAWEAAGDDYKALLEN